MNEKKYIGVKETNNEIIFYFLDGKLVKCKYNHQIKSRMSSDDKYFLATEGIRIFNNRNKKDIADVDDNLHEGME